MGAVLVLLSVIVPPVVFLVALVVVARSIVVIGPAQVGLVAKRFSTRHNTTDTPLAFDGEAGYQSDLLMPGVRFKLWPTYTVSKYPWVQVGRDRRRHLPDRREAAHRCEVGRVPA